MLVTLVKAASAIASVGQCLTGVKKMNSFLWPELVRIVLRRKVNRVKDCHGHNPLCDLCLSYQVMIPSGNSQRWCKLPDF